MAVQWTVHVPQAMQRHGASLKPCGDAAKRNVQTDTVRPAAEPAAAMKAER